MKILLVMESWDSTTGPYESLYPFYKNILEALGHQVQIVDNKRNYLPWGGQTMWNYRQWHHRLGIALLNNSVVQARLRHLAQNWQPDLILLSKCENIFYATIAWVRRHTSAVIFNWYHDNPFWAENTSLDLLRSIRLYDAFGIWARFLFPALGSIGCRRIEYLPMFFNVERLKISHGIDASDHARFASDIVFVGNGSAERAEMLRHLVDFDLAIWGGNWDLLQADDPLRSKIRGPALNGQEYARALCCAKIAVNVLNLSNRPGSNTRTFEATGMGTLLLTEYTREQAEDLFVDGREIVCYHSPADLRDKVRYYVLVNDIVDKRKSS